MCAQGLDLADRTLGCAAGHRFDLARQGYVNLAVGSRATGDTPGMVAARDQFLGAGHYAPVAAALADRAVPGLVVDVGGGTGYYLAAVVERTGGRGVVLEPSTPALKRAARAHPRVAAVGGDVWRGLPFADASADLVTTVFAPRGAAEVARVLRPGGSWVVVTPLPEHLEEVRGPLGMVGVEEGKAERLHADLAAFAIAAEDELRFTRTFTRPDLRALVLMGPSAFHTDEAALRERLDAVPEAVDVTVAVRLTVAHLPP
ncbi:methyltransferase domain-containing protein [Kineococcus rhizosphaerae]|uniref:23S rRNA m(1)G-748 methyltransferase n=1 Tax=Kineococcus rhizosphaerae TaxID=559628 RepID=A0A2T0R6L9_9ACTN|nr:methyltransferase domain-containing protein [Kineococcus rhizosphaerae]PRY16816.1 23S rRNA m(1)G-748 methyltransferase [Kineococcus rhizosphaerae]